MLGASRRGAGSPPFCASFNVAYVVAIEEEYVFIRTITTYI